MDATWQPIRAFESKPEALGIIVAEFPSGVRPVLTLTSRIAIEQYYNRQRLHSALGYRPPEEFERESGRTNSADSSGATVEFVVDDKNNENEERDSTKLPGEEDSKCGQAAPARFRYSDLKEAARRRTRALWGLNGMAGWCAGVSSCCQGARKTTADALEFSETQDDRGIKTGEAGKSRFVEAQGTERLRASRHAKISRC
jgi:hypothetical protein